MLIFFLIIRRPPTPTLFPYTTLFRSCSKYLAAISLRRLETEGRREPCSHASHMSSPGDDMRSEEHTSELQSQFHLVCRLLLEKKNKLKGDVVVAHDQPRDGHRRLEPR